jgi:hypothetical protein
MLAQMDDAPWITALEPLTPTLPYDIAVTAGGVPTAELAKITAPALILGGKNSPGWSNVRSPTRPLPRQARN